MKQVPLAAIEFDSGTQVRAQIDVGVVTEYAERMDGGDKFPWPDLFQDGERFFIGDGWHRLLAAQKNDAVTFPCMVFPGGKPAAVKHALGANAKHGLKRSKADRDHAIEIALREFPDLSDREIGKLCAVNHETVGVRRKPQVADSAPTTPRTGADGKSYPATQPAKSKDDEVWPFTEQDRQEALAAQAAAAAAATAPAQVSAPSPSPAAETERQPLLKPGATASAFDSASWKARVIAANTTFLREVPLKHRETAAEFIATHAKQILEVL